MAAAASMPNGNDSTTHGKNRSCQADITTKGHRTARRGGTAVELADQVMVFLVPDFLDTDFQATVFPVTVTVGRGMAARIPAMAAGIMAADIMVTVVIMAVATTVTVVMVAVVMVAAAITMMMIDRTTGDAIAGFMSVMVGRAHGSSCDSTCNSRRATDRRRGRIPSSADPRRRLSCRFASRSPR